MEEINIERGWLYEIKNNFTQRWNIEIEDRFYERCITFVSKMIDTNALLGEVEYEAFLIAGEPYKGIKKIQNPLNAFRNYFQDTNFEFHKTALYDLLTQIKKEKFLEVLEHIINFYNKNKDDEIITTFNDIAFLSNKPVRLHYNDRYEFYPSDIEIFDKFLINDVLAFLKDYPKSKEQLSEALRLFLKKEHYRDAVDKTRLALELFLKQLLKNEKSLENQKEELCKYFGNTLDENIKKMFLNILNFYQQLNNNRAKHCKSDSKKFKHCEVQFLFYLVGNFLRLFMQIKQDF